MSQDIFCRPDYAFWKEWGNKWLPLPLDVSSHRHFLSSATGAVHIVRNDGFKIKTQRDSSNSGQDVFFIYFKLMYIYPYEWNGPSNPDLSAWITYCSSCSWQVTESEACDLTLPAPMLSKKVQKGRKSAPLILCGWTMTVHATMYFDTLYKLIMELCVCVLQIIFYILAWLRDMCCADNRIFTCDAK